MTRLDILDKLSNKKCRSKWDEAVTQYAIDILIDLDEEPTNTNYITVNTLLLNGAKDWNQYSYFGNSLCYDSDIAERVCTPSEYKKTFAKGLNPNRNENWLDCQARALVQASYLIYRMYNEA